MGGAMRRHSQNTGWNGWLGEDTAWFFPPPAAMHDIELLDGAMNEMDMDRNSKTFPKVLGSALTTGVETFLAFP